MFRCRQTSHIKRFIAVAVISSMFLVSFLFYRNPSKSLDIVRSVTSEIRPSDTGDDKYHSRDVIGYKLQARRRHLDVSTSSSSSSSSVNDSLLSSADSTSRQQSVDNGPNEKQHRARNTELPRSNMDDSPPPFQVQSVPRTSHVTPEQPIGLPSSAVYRSKVGHLDVNPRSIEDNQILKKHFNPQNENKVVESRPAAVDAVDAAGPAGGASNTDSPAQSGQQQSRYIPHRCPPGFDKIADQEYENWFLNNVVQRSPSSGHSTSTFSDEILILTPISNSAKHLQRYFENICSLVYPHRLISIVLGEDSSNDNTVETAQQMTDQLSSYFQRVELVKLPMGSNTLAGQNRRHEHAWQFTRRRHLAIARNRLLMQALGSVGPRVRWVLWIDSDIRHIPRDLVRHLVAVNQSVVVPNCLWKQDNGQTATYDRNTWQETDLSRAELHAMASDGLMLEGYMPTKRRYLNDVKTDGDIVPVDGVGGCILLVDADLHRSGLVFPPYVFDHHIETEGFAKSVARFGTRMYGLPSVNVIHW